MVLNLGNIFESRRRGGITIPHTQAACTQLLGQSLRHQLSKLPGDSHVQPRMGNSTSYFHVLPFFYPIKGWKKPWTKWYFGLMNIKIWSPEYQRYESNWLWLLQPDPGKSTASIPENKHWRTFWIPGRRVLPRQSFWLTQRIRNSCYFHLVTPGS